ncbi:hypothetical protein FACS1894199_03090 [Bacteroidia bacterium]|nr:hypothetical protein FACS1894199_03090 [Bacteroidia bacterium]
MGVLLSTVAAANAQGPWNCGRPESGTIPTNAVTATLTGTSPNYTLTIIGTGDMANYDDNSSSSRAPWNSNRSNITSVSISGVTSIGDYAFNSCSGLTSVTIPRVLTPIHFSQRTTINKTRLQIPNLSAKSVKKEL